MDATLLYTFLYTSYLFIHFYILQYLLYILIYFMSNKRNVETDMFYKKFPLFTDCFAESAHADLDILSDIIPITNRYTIH
jgi:hypothetical protein